MNKPTEHTPGEWKNTITGIKDERGFLIAQFWCGQDNNSYGNIPAVTDAEMRANAERCVKAVNLYDELLSLLNEANELLLLDPDYSGCELNKAIRNALNKSEA